ncbi:MAG: MFS transporter [Alphaproteobacteria bacterium]|nr:MFS transporter [Alphaproteobacteria bacterium]
MAVEPAAQKRESAYAYLRLVTSLALMTIGGAGMFSIVVALKPLAAEFGASRSATAIAYTVTTVGFGLGGVLMGRLADRVGIVLPTLVGAVALALGFFLAGRAEALWQLYLAQGLLIGFLGNSAVFAPLVADITHWFTRRRGMAVAIVISGNYLAGVVWPPVVQYGIDTVGWRQTYTAIAVFCLVSMGPLALLLYRRAEIATGPSGRAATDRGRPLGLAPRALQCLLCFAGIGCCVAMAVPQAHIVAHASDLGHLAARGAEMLALMLATGIVSRLVFGWISDRIGGLKTLLLGSALQAVTLSLFMTVDGLVGLYLVSALFGLSQGGIVPSYAIIVATFFRATEAGWRIGLVMLSTLAGMGVGGWLAGLLYDLTGSYDAAFVNAVVINLLNTAVAVGLLRRARRLALA